MKVIYKISFFLLLNFFSIYCNSQTPGFAKVYQDTFARFSDLIVDKDTLIFYGLEVDSTTNKVAQALYKFSSEGDKIKKSLISKEDYNLKASLAHHKIIKTKRGGYALYLVDKNSGFSFFVEVKKSFEELIFQKYSNPIGDLPISLVETKSGYFLLSDFTTFTGKYGSVYLTSIDKAGNFQWRKEYGTDTLRDFAEDIIKIDDNTYWITGRETKDEDFFRHEEEDYFKNSITVIDSLGVVQDYWTSEGESDFSMSDLIFLDNGDFIHVGGDWVFIEEEGYLTKNTITRRDKDFNLVWKKQVGTRGWPRGLKQIRHTLDGNLLAMGTNNGYLLHYKFTPDGDSIWVRHDNLSTIIYIDSIPYYTEYTIGSGLGILSDGSSVTSGQVKIRDVEAGTNIPYGFLMKISPDGCIDTFFCNAPVSVSDLNEVPKMELSIYPNPSFGRVTFKLLSGKALRDYGIKLRDLRGVDQGYFRFGANRKTLSLDLDLPSGIYFVELYENGVFVEVKKLIIQ